MEELSARQQEIIKFMKQYMAEWGYPPTVRDIAAAVRISSTSTVHKELKALAEKGIIKKQDGKRRAMDFADTDRCGKEADFSRTDVVDIPVIGRIAAGTPILAEENIEDSFPIPARYIKNGSYFMLTVHGESMVEAGIFNGDYILIRETQDIKNGDIVAAMIDGFESEATVKGFYKEEGHIRLQPYNSSMSPIIVKDCRVLGKIAGVFRYIN